MVAYNKAFWKATHNSYSMGERGSIGQQLDAGVRFLELDVHYDASRSGEARFRVGHDNPGSRVYYGGGNPAGDALGDWLDVIVAWSAQNPGHTPITVLFDSKDNLGPSGQDALSPLNALLKSHLGEALYLATEKTGDWPSVSDLAGRVVTVLSGDATTRLAYRDAEQVMFLEYQNNGDAKLKSAPFYAASAEASPGWAFDGMKDGKIVRLWQYTNSDAKKGKPVSAAATDTPYASWYADYCGSAGALDAAKPGSIPVYPPMTWGDSHQYDSGQRPALAVNRNGLAVEVHKSQNEDTLWYRVGIVDTAAQTIDWGDAVKYDKGREPAVAIDQNGNVVEVHTSQNEDTLWYHVGTVDQGKRRIDWGDSHRYDSGVSPSVALRSDGLVVEAHESQNRDHVWCHVGVVDKSKKTIDWGDSTEYDSGRAPSVAMNESGVVVEVHRTQNTSAGLTLWSHAGTVDAEKRAIDWGPSRKYDTGIAPSVAIDDAGLVVEVHQSENENTVWYHVGVVNQGFVGWLASYRYDAGVSPSVAMLPGGVVVEAHKSDGHDTLWWHLGQVRTYP